ncbi:ribose import ATP-binding protein RbsA 1 [Acidocella aquatica]|uniref:Ribose import ATP-binding protein RbsA 1 n=1 Tax=Acidocella aquatica TaxID=1922313 RepID=A0ABQ6A3W1_9PROT|nr:sugar ABC transporter ATP-binding protein [Acidocella aquatica]GLR66844.1 ribose import ATP-binding protein RbsA 1 [Acidocella aquatica]
MSRTSGLLAAAGIDKRFGANSVLRNVSLSLAPGEVHTLMGENGAGKSTLFRILAGIHQPDAGQISLDGAALDLRNPSAAYGHGIYLVPQEPALLKELSVAENMFLGMLPTRGRFPSRIDWKTIRGQAQDALSALGLDVDVRDDAKHLSIAQQQLVECAKALLRGCRIILFDEPTSPLTGREVGILFAIMRRLRGQGCTLGFISHRMEEVSEISDRVSVLRDGAVTDEVGRDGFDRARLVRAMVGREVIFDRRRVRREAQGEPVLSVRGLAHAPVFSGVDFDVRPGEILGFSGLIGSGRTEIAEAVCGLRAKSGGSVMLAGRDISTSSIGDIIEAGLVYVPEDRARHGVILPMSIRDNATAGQIGRLQRKSGILNRGREIAIANDTMHRYQVRARGIDQPAGQLSGGNQQKIVFGKWMSTNPKVAILDEPTRGVDVGAKDEIYRLIEELSAQGMAIVVISSELEELIVLCDRVIAIYGGKIAAELKGADVTAARVGAAFLGAEAH